MADAGQDDPQGSLLRDGSDEQFTACLPLWRRCLEPCPARPSWMVLDQMAHTAQPFLQSYGPSAWAQAARPCSQPPALATEKGPW